jgi:hypothetical protein
LLELNQISGGTHPTHPCDDDAADTAAGNVMKKAIGGKAKSLSESEEYKRRLKKLENFISKNRLVSKEAQMSAMSEGSYKDPRFLNTTGHPLIDQYGMHPFPAEGSGQILSTTDLGMEGPESMFGRSLYGQYNPKEDTIIYKDLDKNIEGHKGYTSKEDTQKHELVHRTVQRSGWLDNFYNSPYLNDNAKLISGNKGKTLSPLINEALAHSYETLDKEELKKQIRFRASKFNLKEPDKIADEIFNNIEYLKNDFENHLEEINPNLTKYTRIKKTTGGEASNLQAAIDLLNNPVTSSISPLGDPTLSPLMESLQKNPIDDFAMMMADPTKVGLKVINTPIKMQFKKLFAARGKFQQLVDKQKFKYDRGLDLASKADPKDIAQGTLQAHVALKSGKRFQRQLNDVEEKIRKLYKNK